MQKIEINPLQLFNIHILIQMNKINEYIHEKLNKDLYIKYFLIYKF